MQSTDNYYTINRHSIYSHMYCLLINKQCVCNQQTQHIHSHVLPINQQALHIQSHTLPINQQTLHIQSHTLPINQQTTCIQSTGTAYTVTGIAY